MNPYSALRFLRSRLRIETNREERKRLKALIYQWTDELIGAD